MKRSLLLCLALSLSIFTFAQAPKGINYQGVARDATGSAIANTTISVRISILKNSATGETEYAEVHRPQTNQFGLFTLVIGQGTASTASFTFVSWAVGNKWLQIEIDPAGGSSYVLAGSQQLMSVPYALYAEYSGNGLTAGQGIAINNNIITNTGDQDNSITNELITNLALTSDKKLQVTEAGTTRELDLSGLAGSAQDLNSVLTQGNSAGSKKITNLATPNLPADAATKAYVDAHTDADASVSNELQTLTLAGTNLVISGGNQVNIGSINTDNQNLSLGTPAGTSRTINITNGSGVTFDVADNDNSITNEIQNLFQVLTQSNSAGNTRIINLGAPVAGTDAATKQYADDLDALDLDKSITNEIQNLTQVLAQNNSAGNTRIINLGTPTAAADAATKQYVDNLDALDLDKSIVNEIQNLSQVLAQNNSAATLRITNLGAPLAADDAATKQYVDNLSALDLDKSVTNEIQTLSKSGATISLTSGGSVTLNDDSNTNEIQDLTLNAATNILRITNNASAANIDLTPYRDNTDGQTLTYTPATNNLAISGGNNVTISTSLSQVLTTNPSAGGTRIQNVGTPTANADAATKGYVDTSIATAIATTYAFKTSFSYTNSSAILENNRILPFTTEDFDDFNVLASNSFTATEAGVYVFMVDGTHFANIAGGQLSLLYNGVKYPVAIVQPWGSATARFNASLMFRLTAGQTVSLVGDNILVTAAFSGVFSGYKL